MTSHPTCNRRGVITRVCAKPARFTMRVSVAGFEVQLLACVDCHAKAPASPGVWEPVTE